MRLDDLFDPVKLKDAWAPPSPSEPEDAAPPAAAPAPPPAPADLLLEELALEARRETGPLGGPGIDVLVERARESLARGAKGRPELAEALDALEDLIEACAHAPQP